MNAIRRWFWMHTFSKWLWRRRMRKSPMAMKIRKDLMEEFHRELDAQILGVGREPQKLQGLFNGKEGPRGADTS